MSQLFQKRCVVSLSRLDKLGEVRVRERVLGVLVPLKDVMRHIFLVVGVFVGLFGVFRLRINGCCDQIVHSFHLLLGKGRKNLTDCLVPI